MHSRAILQQQWGMTSGYDRVVGSRGCESSGSIGLLLPKRGWDAGSVAAACDAQQRGDEQEDEEGEAQGQSSEGADCFADENAGLLR